MAQVMAKHLQSPPPFDELQGLPRGVVSLLAHMLEKDPAKRPNSPAHLVEEIEQCVAAVKGEVPQIAPTNLISPSTTPIPELKKMSAAREPAAQRPAREFFLAEVLIGAAIAVIIYLILSRPVEAPPPASPRNQPSQARRTETAAPPTAPGAKREVLE